MISIVITMTIAVIMMVAVFSVFPTLLNPITGLECPPESGEVCKSLVAQTALLPTILVIAVVISAILIVTRMFSMDDFSYSSDDEEEEKEEPPTVKEPQNKQSRSQNFRRWFRI